MRKPLHSTRLLLLLALGCGAEHPSAEQDATADSSTALTQSAAPQWLDGPSFFLMTRAIELTGDAVPDTLFLAAHGAHSDSIRIALGAIVQGDTAELARWDSRYQLQAVRGAEPPSEAARLALLRTQLRAVLQSVSTEPFDGASWIGPWVTTDDDPDCTARTQSCMAASIRQALRSPPSTGGTPFDTARAASALKELRAVGRVQVEFRYGTESSAQVVWSPMLQRFVTVFSCC
jgi:hypothetical protein